VEQTGRRRPTAHREDADTVTSVVGQPSLSADKSDDLDDRPLTTRTRWENLLGLLILFEAARVLYYVYPALGLIADDRFTNLGRLIWPCLAAASMYAILRRPWTERRSLDPLVVVPILMISASFIWSVDSFRTLYQSIVLTAALVCGLYLSIAYRRRELVSLVSNALGIVIAINVVAAIAGVNSGPKQTTGFFEHKNILGPVAAIALILFLARIASGERHRLVWLGTAATGIALFMSGSRTSQCAAFIVLMVAAFVAVRRQSQAAALAFTPPILAMFAVVLRIAGGTEAIFEAGGKSSDLTGRTDIWATVASLIAERPIAGWGYVAYWRDEGFANGGRSGFQEFGLRSAHNGYLEAALGAGLLAGALVAICLLTLTVRGYRRSTISSPRASDVALGALGLFGLIANLSEAIFPASTLVLLTILIVALSAGPRAIEFEP
jgi:exopolysaccharide production protein ExoQ